jgi:hypothetical protein
LVTVVGGVGRGGGVVGAGPGAGDGVLAGAEADAGGRVTGVARLAELRDADDAGAAPAAGVGTSTGR